jgi:Mce-associated membrane protein
VVTTRAFMLSRPLLVVSSGLVVIAAVCAGWFGWSWHRSSHGTPAAASTGSGGASPALVRQVLEQGEQDVQNFNTLSYRNLAAGLARWRASSTGVLRSETVNGWAAFAKQVTKAQTTTTATILDAALTSLDPGNGTAGIIVAVQLTVTPAHGSAATKRNRLQGTLTRTSSGWKLSSLGVVPVGTQGATHGATPSTSPSP